MKKCIKILLMSWLMIWSMQIFSTSAARSSAGVPWQPYSNTVFAQAQQAHRLILMYGKAAWCHYCQQMNITYQDPRVVALVKNNFIPVLVDIDDNADIAKQYQIESFPALIIINEKHQVLERVTGFFPPEEIIDKLQMVIGNHSH